MTQRVVNYTYGTGNPVLPDGSIDVRDGIDNLQSFDVFMNADEDTYNQRDGDIVKTRAGAVRAVGIQRVGDFTTGCTVTERNQGVLYETDGTVYVWLGALPKSVPAGSSPATTGDLGPAGWLDIGDASAYARITSELSSSSGTSLIGAEHSGTVEDHLRTIINVDPFIARDERVIDGLHNARDYIASIGGGVGILSAKVYLLEDEYIPADRVIMRGQGVGPSWSGSTILKWAGGVGGGKAVVRSSRYPLGTEGPLAFSGVGVQNCIIDADGCDVGLYSYYTTNNSDFDGIVTRNATIANTYIIKSWFTNYGKQQARDGKNRGIVIGKPLFGETGDIAVNACGFGWMQCKSNGTSVSSYNPAGLSDAGAGLVLGTFANSNHFPSVQSEGNNGVGVHSSVSFASSFGSVYLESNSGASSGEKCAWMNLSGGSVAAISVQTTHLATGQTIKNNVGRGMIIDSIHRGDNINTFTGTGELVVLGGNLTSFSATDWTKVAKTHHQLLSAQNVNVRYSSGVQGATRFVTHAVLAYPQITIVPRATVTLASPLSLGIDANPKQNYGSSFTANVPVTLRHSAVMSIGAHNLEVGGTLPTADTLFDIYLTAPLLAGSGLQSPSI